MQTALEYAEAIYIVEMFVFIAMKLVTVYAGVMHSMPIYPATSELEAITLW
jgi:hypothetical protein